MLVNVGHCLLRAQRGAAFAVTVCAQEHWGHGQLLLSLPSTAATHTPRQPHSVLGAASHPCCPVPLQHQGLC